jgi:hypothetical protein
MKGKRRRRRIDVFIALSLSSIGARSKEEGLLV